MEAGKHTSRVELVGACNTAADFSARLDDKNNQRLLMGIPVGNQLGRESTSEIGNNEEVVEVQACMH